MAILTVTVEPELKKAYLAACREDGCSGAQVIRAAMQTIVDGSRDPDRLRAALRLDADHPVAPGSPAHAMQIVRRVTAELLDL